MSNFTHVGVLIPWQKTLFLQVTENRIIRKTCPHSPHSENINYCLTCGIPLNQPEIYSIYKCLFPGFLNRSAYRYNGIDYEVYRNPIADTYFIKILSITDNYYTTHDPDTYINALQISKAITEELQKADLNSVPGISRFKNYLDYD
jgi:hypothetical protein